MIKGGDQVDQGERLKVNKLKLLRVLCRQDHVRHQTVASFMGREDKCEMFRVSPAAKGMDEINMNNSTDVTA